MPTFTRGFTLTELLICLAIVAILASLSAPSLAALVANNQRLTLVNQLLGVLHYARGTALTTGIPVSVCAGAQGCAVGPNWQTVLWIFQDPARRGIVPADGLPLKVEYLPKHYRWQWNGFGQTDFLHYRANGRILLMNGRFVLCHKDQPVYQVVLNVTGRPRAEAPTPSASCDSGAP